MNITAQQLYEEITESIKGQDEYVRNLATVVWLQKLRREYAKTSDKTDGKINMLVIGKSGTGKTATVEEMSKVAKIPCLIADITTFTGSGWKGRDLNEIIAEMLVKTNCDTTDTEYSIIVLDEFDKLFNNMHSNDSSFCVLSSLLKFIEGTTIPITIDKESYIIDTKNILFVCCGAFDGLEEIISNRLNTTQKIGFNTAENADISADSNILQNVTEQDLMDFGISAQILGRFGSISVLNTLDVDVMTDIILNSNRSVVRSLHRLLNVTQDVSVEISPAAAREIAKQCIETEVGARGLAQIVYKMLLPHLFMLETANIKKLKIDFDGRELFIDIAVADAEAEERICGVKICNLEVIEPYVLCR